ncbi:MAG: hypothetical protein HGA86_07880, partial [Anaerolineaceae bacterium]|nr:hypothetical protein [Anaerolineaceae bacterium]
MKRHLFCLILLAALVLAGCSPQTTAATSTLEPTPVWTVVFPTVVVPSSDLPPKSGDFTPYFPADEFPTPEITGMSFDGQGNPWITTVQSASRWDGKTWVPTALFDGLLVDVDPAGRVWVTSMDGSTLSAWVNGAWQVYGADQGWAAVENYVYIPVVPGMQADRDGNLWLATAQDVRRFDGKTWKIFSQKEMTLPDPEEFDSFPIFNLALDNTS